jgi:hypothetical protein
MQAAEYLHSKNASKTVKQWKTVLMDNSRTEKRHAHVIPLYRGANNMSFYKPKDLDVFLAAIHAKRENQAVSRAEEIKAVYGTNDQDNDNGYGQNFGYKWQGATVTQITDNADTSPDGAAIQMIIYHPLRASALTLQQAKEFVQDQLDVIKRIDPSYKPK